MGWLHCQQELPWLLVTNFTKINKGWNYGYLGNLFAKPEEDNPIETRDAEAQYKISLKYHGGHGLPRDYAQAMMWYLIAKKGGTALADQNLQELETLSTPAQIAEAKRMAREWLAAHLKKS